MSEGKLYRSTDNVIAFRIARVLLCTQGTGMLSYLICPKSESIKPVIITAAWFEAHQPKNGGYLLKHTNGSYTFMSNQDFKKRFALEK